MSFDILDRDIRPQIDPAKQAAQRMRMQAKQTYRQLIDTFNRGARQFWANSNATPAEIAAELGEDAAAVFQLHGLLGQLLAQVRPEAIAAGMSVVGEFEYNEDGTITVN